MTGAAPTSVALDQAVEEFLEWLAIDKRRSPNTVNAYQRDLATFVTFCGSAGLTRLDQVDRDVLRGFQSDLARRRAGRRSLAATTRHRRLVALRSLLKFCARERWAEGDLGVTIDLPQLPRRLPKPLNDAELARLHTDPNGGDQKKPSANAMPSHLRDRALVAFLLSTGCRISEALALDRVDWQSDRVIVRGKGDIERTVIITSRAREEVDRYLASRTDASPALFVSYSPGRTGRRLSVRGAEAVCARLGTAAEIAKLHPHRFRHTAGTIVQEELGDPLLTADYLGHNGLGSVAGYAAVSRQRRADAAGALAERGL